jgi:NAD kinase
MTKKITPKITWKDAFLRASAAARPANPPPITIADGVCGFLLAFSPYEPDMDKICFISVHVTQEIKCLSTKCVQKNKFSSIDRIEKER